MRREGIPAGRSGREPGAPLYDALSGCLFPPTAPRAPAGSDPRHHLRTIPAATGLDLKTELESWFCGQGRSGFREAVHRISVESSEYLQQRRRSMPRDVSSPFRQPRR
ncbi:hypothetical protein THIOKS190119 [Thiocapsa sp. KS1]|nr:hypothetical protein THIOKS190119 [Thiocapsa sp. KS1]